MTDIFAIGGIHSYLRVSCLQRTTVKSGEENFILSSLKRFKELLFKHKLLESKYGRIDFWIDKLTAYPDGEEIKSNDAQFFYEEIISWSGILRVELSQLETINVHTSGSLNYKRLINGGSEFFQKSIWEKLPKISKNDLDEATKCILCQIPTASSMISLRAIEDVLRGYYKHKTKKDPGRNGWKKNIDELLKKDSEGKLIYDVNISLMQHLDYIRENKRNVAEHPEKIFTQREAEGIFLLMVHTITEIHMDMK